MTKSTSSHQQKRDLIRLYRRAIVEGVAITKIEEKLEKLMDRFVVADNRETSEVKEKDKHYRRSIPRVLRLGAAILPTVLLLLGLGLVGSATLPILGYYVSDFSDNLGELKSPVSADQLLDSTPLALTATQEASGTDFGTLVNDDSGPIILNSALDYTNLSNWFSGSEVSLNADQEAVTYTLDIPDLKISNAQVLVGGTDLNHSLIQYPGTALPGQAGSPVIFGHSVLRQFYSPAETNPRRYNSIFSFIMTLEKGDKIYLTHDNVRYTYVVQSKTEVKPTDTFILSQRYDARQLKLVTCVPEGTYLRRGVITAQLVRE